MILSSSLAPTPLLAWRARISGAEVENLSFCFGVRSPWRVMATTQRSSEPLDAPGAASCGRSSADIESSGLGLMMEREPESGL